MDAFAELLMKERFLKENHVLTEESIQDGMPPRFVGYRDGRVVIAASIYTSDPNEMFTMASVAASGTACDELAVLMDISMTDAMNPANRVEMLITVKGDRKLNVRFASQRYEVEDGKVRWMEVEEFRWSTGRRGVQAPFMESVREIMSTPLILDAMQLAGDYVPGEMSQKEVNLTSLVSTMVVVKTRGHDVAGFLPEEDKPLLDEIMNRLMRSGVTLQELEFQLY